MPVLKLLYKNKYAISNLDINIILESPKLKHHISKMKNNLSKLLNMDNADISIKAKTSDKIGSIGANKAIINKHPQCNKNLI